MTFTPSVVITPRVEMFVPNPITPAWVDASRDVVSSVRAEWGIKGDDPKSRVADPGTMSFELDNSTSNTAGLRGYYSPGHANCRAGFAIGTPVRLVLNHVLFGDKVKWVGTVAKAMPRAGNKNPSTAVTCVDWMDEAQRSKVKGIVVQTNVQSDALFNILVAAVDRQPPGGAFAGSGSDVYPFALDNTQDEKSKVHGELVKLAMSEFGIIYVSAGVLVFEGRRRRGGQGSIRFALDEDDNIVAMGVKYDRDDVLGRVQVSIHPRRRDAAPTTVLFNLGSSIQIPINTGVVINCPYRDPNQQAQRVGGVNMQAPVAGVDYFFNSQADGLGNNLTSQLTITPVFGGNSAEVTVFNNGPFDGYVPANGLKLKGQGLYDFEPIISDREDAASTAAYGDNVYAYDMPYQSVPSNGSDVAQFILALNKDARTRLDSVTYVANWSDATVEQAFNLEISDRISINAPTIGFSAKPFFVNGVRLEVHMNGVVVVTYDVSPVDTTQFWILEVPGRTELDQTTILGYGLFVAGWLLDTSLLGTDTFLN